MPQTRTPKNWFWKTLLVEIFLTSKCSISIKQFWKKPDPSIAISVGACIFATFLLTSGFLMPAFAIPIYWKWVYYISFITYSFEIMVFNEYEGHYVAQYLHMEDVDVGRNMGILSGYTFGLQMMFFIILFLFHTGKMWTIFTSKIHPPTNNTAKYSSKWTIPWISLLFQL